MTLHASIGIGSTGSDAPSGASDAALRACERTQARRADAVVFVTSVLDRPSFESVARTIRRTLDPASMLGVMTGTPVAGAHAWESGMQVVVQVFDGLRAATFDEDSLDAMGRASGSALVVDRASVPIASILPDLQSRRNGSHVVGAVGPADEFLLALDDRILDRGLGGMTFADVRVDAFASQGSTPIDEDMLITRARGHLILEIAGERAVEVVREIASNVESRSPLAPTDLLVGRVLDEHKPRFGRSDYLIRPIIGIDEDSGAIAVTEQLRVGQTVRLHVPDPLVAHEDLDMLLDVQRLHGPGAAAILCQCTRRGSSFFGRSGHDAGMIARALRETSVPAEQRARGGTPLDPTEPDFPLVGWSAATQLGPVGVSMHGHAACCLVLR